MKVLLVHNFYQQTGGEDQVYADEAGLLTARGHEVVRFTVHNDDVKKMTRLGVSARTIWNGKVYAEILDIVRREQIQIAHFHNTFPLISPAALYAARKGGAAVVATLHNFRMVCANGLLFRAGKVCEECIGRDVPLPAVLHSCYRDSAPGSAVVAAMLTVHRMLGSWERMVDVLITPSHFAKSKLVQAGFAPDRLTVKPNFIQGDPRVGDGSGGYVLFAGRLSPEKGVETLLSAWSQLKGQIPLRIAGDGPMAERVRQAAAADSSITCLGRRSTEEIFDLMGAAALLVFPSVCYETFGKTIVEAFAKGTPVLASRQGAMAELIMSGRTGAHCEPGNADDLAARVRELFADPVQLAHMRLAARREYQKCYTADENYRLLVQAYRLALERRKVEVIPDAAIATKVATGKATNAPDPVEASLKG